MKGNRRPLVRYVLCSASLTFGQNSRRRHRSRGAVLPSHRVPPDPHHFQRHLRTVHDWMNSGSLVMSPDDRHFSHFETHSAGEEQDLCIKAPSFNPLQREKRLRSAPPERLEAALRVLEVQGQQESQQQVKPSTHHLPCQGLPLRLQLATN